jgi:hypothetical protein
MSFPQASNNEDEYEALLHGMKMAKACGATRLKIFGDSNLIVQQVMNQCDAISDNMMAYQNLYYYLEGTFDGCEVSHISRASNEEANNLANIGSLCLSVPPCLGSELPSVLWSLRTTPNAATQETPFFPVHGAEAVLLVETTHEAPRIVAYDETTSNEALQDDINALNEARDVALARDTQHQQSLQNYHSTQVRACSFVVRDLVLRVKQDGHGKLESPWVGPYIVTKVIPGGAYRLQDKKIGKDESNPWNAEQL